MKPKDLKFPYRFAQRRPELAEGLFFVPDYYFDHADFDFPGWYHPFIFNKVAPIRIEFCSGNGSWLIERAERDPLSNYVAIEKRFDRVQKIWSKRANRKIDNLFIICGEAQTVISNYLPSQSIEEAFINFPDPFPKRRGAKHRLIKPVFVEQLARIMKAKSHLTFVTDHKTYMDNSIACFLENRRFIPVCDFPHISEQVEGYGTSYFDTLWRSKGEKIYYFQATC